jgi:hypothetical protein
MQNNEAGNQTPDRKRPIGKSELAAVVFPAAHIKHWFKVEMRYAVDGNRPKYTGLPAWF